MNLWIRSQDKNSLVKVGCDITVDDTNSVFCDYDQHLLGSYATKERALEVLDEIQEFRDALIGFEMLPQKERKQIVTEFLEEKETLTYQMPKE